VQITRRGRRRTNAAAVVLALGVVPAGCSSGGPVPDGWEQVESEWLSVAVPAGWQSVEPVNDQWRLAWSADGGDDAQQLSAIPGLGYYDADQARGIVATGGGLNASGVEQVETTTVTDEDNLTVLRTTFTFDHDGQPMEGVLWVAAEQEPDDRAVAVQLTGVELDPEIIDGVEASIRVIDGQRKDTP
jgi:hypothetical protein